MVKIGRKGVGLTFGAFDMLHIGHLNLLRRASFKCDKLVVCVSDDEYIEKVKGRKPIIPFKDRVRLVMALTYVDDVGYQSLDFNKEDAINEYQPDILFVGDDWNKETYKGEGFGVPVEYMPYTKGVSTTEIIAKVKKYG